MSKSSSILLSVLLCCSPAAFGGFSSSYGISSQYRGAQCLNQDANVKDILAWADEAVSAIYNYNYLNHSNSIAATSQYFATRDAMHAFEQSFTTSGILSEVISNKYQVSAVRTGPAVIVPDEIGGLRTWQVKMPVLVTYHGAARHVHQPVVIDLLIMRTSPGVGVKYFGIQQFIAKNAV